MLPAGAFESHIGKRLARYRHALGICVDTGEIFGTKPKSDELQQARSGPASDVEDRGLLAVEVHTS